MTSTDKQRVWTPAGSVTYEVDEPSPTFDGRFVALEATDPTLMQRLFGG